MPDTNDTRLPLGGGIAQPLELRHSVVKEGARRFGILHTSLVGMTAIILILLFAVALPVFGYAPVARKGYFYIILTTTFGGIGYLYYMNYAVYKLVSDHDRLTEVLVNSLGQGFLSFGRSGNCDDVYSQACLDLLETVPAGKNIMDVLHVSQEARSDFQDWLEVLFMPDHALGFQDVVNFLPHFFSHTENRRITLVYRPIYMRPGALGHVVLIATDETEEHIAQELAQTRQEYADMICRVFRERNQFLATITHIRTFLNQAIAPTTREESTSLMRLLHTLKAAVNHFHLKDLGEMVHTLESELRSDAITSDEEFMRVLEAGRRCIERGLEAVLDNIKDLIGQDYERRGNTNEIEENTLYNFALSMKIAGVSPEILDHYLRFIVAVPAQDCLRQFDRELVDLAEITGKQLKPVKYSGSNPPILMRKYEALFFSLTHICRNIIDHGIEPAVTRLTRNKDPSGQVAISVNVVEGEDNQQWLALTIADDGGGIDPSRIRAKLAVSAPNGAWRSQDDHAVIQNIFSFGFSTSETITELSGQGVGMEAVEREVKILGGTIEVFSELYRDTRFEIRVPYYISV